MEQFFIFVNVLFRCPDLIWISWMLAFSSIYDKTMVFPVAGLQKLIRLGFLKHIAGHYWTVFHLCKWTSRCPDLIWISRILSFSSIYDKTIVFPVAGFQRKGRFRTWFTLDWLPPSPVWTRETLDLFWSPSSSSRSSSSSSSPSSSSSWSTALLLMANVHWSWSPSSSSIGCRAPEFGRKTLEGSTAHAPVSDTAI